MPDTEIRRPMGLLAGMLLRLEDIEVHFFDATERGLKRGIAEATGADYIWAAKRPWGGVEVRSWQNRYCQSNDLKPCEDMAAYSGGAERAIHSGPRLRHAPEAQSQYQ